MNSSVEMKKKQRWDFMHELYNATNGNERKWFNYRDVGKAAGIPGPDLDNVTDYLCGEGLAEFHAIGGTMGITHAGVVEVEEALDRQDQPTTHFPAIQNIIHIATMTNSVIQQGTTNSNQTVTLSTSDKDLISTFLAAFKASEKDLRMNSETADEARAEIATIEAQLASPRPRANVIGPALKFLEDVAVKASASLTASAVIAHLPQIHDLLSKLFNSAGSKLFNLTS